MSEERGRHFVVRLPESLYEVLKSRAREAGVKPRQLAQGYLAALLARARRLDKARAGANERFRPAEKEE